MKRLLRWAVVLLVLVALGTVAWLMLRGDGRAPARAGSSRGAAETTAAAPGASTNAPDSSGSATSLPDTGSAGSPLADTPPGTILELGQTWRQGNAELLMTNVDLYPASIHVQFRLTNLGPTEKAVRYSLDNFSAVDSSGRRVAVGGVDWNGDPSAQFDCSAETVILEPDQGDAIYIPCEFGSFDGVVMDVDVGDPSLTGIIITVDGITGISRARWRVPISH